MFSEKGRILEVLYKDIANVKFGHTLTLDMPKGQVFLEGHLDISNSSKKRKKNSALVG